jgi:3-hydroxyisobutyrate dehydrogenase-like beta-hydroxyacid dehydrogenase
MASISLLGLGAMGQRIAKRWWDEAHELTAWNGSPSAALRAR